VKKVGNEVFGHSAMKSLGKSSRCPYTNMFSYYFS